MSKVESWTLPPPRSSPLLLPVIPNKEMALLVLLMAGACLAAPEPDVDRVDIVSIPGLTEVGSSVWEWSRGWRPQKHSGEIWDQSSRSC